MFAVGPQLMHSLVDNFFECKKLQVKQRLRDSMEAIVDDLFGELVGQVKEILAPSKEFGQCGGDLKQLVNNSVPDQINIKSAPYKAKSPKPNSPKLANKPVFAVKSAPSTSSVQPVRGIKRLHESTVDQTITPSSAQTILNSLTTDTETSSLSSKKGVIDLENSNLPEASAVTKGIGSTVEGSNEPEKFNKEQSKFICQSPGCGKRFKKGSHLKDHERTHSKVKPYACKYSNCTFASAKRFNTLEHIRNIHLKNLPDANDPDEGKNPTDYLEVKQDLLGE